MVKSALSPVSIFREDLRAPVVWDIKLQKMAHLVKVMVGHAENRQGVFNMLFLFLDAE